ncbi:hypothetical protein [Reyranella soli]|uniref:hypothetical protein n=1 Tax=Reyranella soli TaxID=1230389 RepID=UPI0014786ECA|nr:hypothetical protein [Reyranella soli]
MAASGLGLLSLGKGTTAQAQVMADGMGVSVEGLKEDLVARLADCETGGKANPDAVITPDANGQASIGRLQFQTRTVIAFTKEIEDRRIDAGEARRIALDGQRSAALAKRIIFERDGAQHWHRCARSLGLYKEVEAIQRLAR